MTAVEQLTNLTALLSGQEKQLCALVLNDPSFVEAPGGEKHHHNFKGGLAQHTLEVAQLAMEFSWGRLEEKNALIAAIFHDYGKIHEYVFKEDGTIGTTEFKTRIGHVTYSAEFFSDAAKNILPSDTRLDIVHAILSHHGRREWGSPVEPATPLAWALHSADMLSSRGFQEAVVIVGEEGTGKDDNAPTLVQVDGWKSDGGLAGGGRLL